MEEGGGGVEARGSDLDDRGYTRRGRSRRGWGQEVIGDDGENMEADHAFNISTIAGVSHETPATSGRRLEHKGLNTGRRLVDSRYWDVARTRVTDKVCFHNIAKVRTR